MFIWVVGALERLHKIEENDTMTLGFWEGFKVFVYLSNKTNCTKNKILDGEL